jgi:hypothetical protein
MPVIIEGVDYSSTGNADWAGLAASLTANGKHFVGRYAVNDKSPGGRGISGPEYRAMKDAGIEVFLYWESTAGWMLQGWGAGVAAAQNAQWNIDTAGIPHDAIVYFACDVDAEESDQAAIDECLRGAASVIGFERVGLYGGYHVIKRALQNGSAKWLCQTSAWSGGMVLPQAQLYQYDYDKYIYGTNCDWVQADVENYGQVDWVEPEPPKPTYPKPRPCPYDVIHGKDWQDSKGNQWWAIRRTVHVKPGTKFYCYGSLNAPESRSPAGPDGMNVTIAGQVNSWYVTPIGSTFKIADADVTARFKKKAS